MAHSSAVASLAAAEREGDDSDVGARAISSAHHPIAIIIALEPPLTSRVQGVFHKEALDHVASDSRRS